MVTRIQTNVCYDSSGATFLRCPRPAAEPGRARGGTDALLLRLGGRRRSEEGAGDEEGARPDGPPALRGLSGGGLGTAPGARPGGGRVVRTTPTVPNRRVVREGAPTNDLVLSAYLASNEQVFPRVLGLYVAPGSVVADVTYGKGVFWRQIAPDRYRVLASDLADGVDCRNLPYEAGSVDCVVFDPPYMHSPGGTAHSKHDAFDAYYRNNRTGNRTRSKYHEAVIDLYVEGGREAYRVLRDLGVFIVKCQDEVCSNRQRFTHLELIREYGDLGFMAEDLFVVVRNNRPGVSRTKKQVHARKNHSYFLVFWKRGDGGALWESPA